MTISHMPFLSPQLVICLVYMDRHRYISISSKNSDNATEFREHSFLQ